MEHIDIIGALRYKRYWNWFVYKGKLLSKEKAVTLLEYGLKKGYKSTSELSDEEINQILNPDETRHRSA